MESTRSFNSRIGFVTKCREGEGSGAIFILKWFAAVFIATVFILLNGADVRAQVGHELIRRLAVFPIKIEKVSDVGVTAESLASATEEAWWQMREEFTRGRRFLVASKQFLQKNDAFQARGGLEPADAIILGRLLDAHALVTVRLEDRALRMNIYDGTSGLLLWDKSLQLHPSLTIGDQLSNVARRLVSDFVATIPYQGFTTVDAATGTAVYEEGEARLAQVDFGISSGVQIGDTVQWIRISGSNNMGPLFQGGGKITIFAEGKVIRIEEGIATVELFRATSLKEVKEYSLVRAPREFERLQAQFLSRGGVRTTMTSELIAPELSPMEQLRRERRPLVTTMSFIGSMAAFLLLAF